MEAAAPGQLCVLVGVSSPEPAVLDRAAGLVSVGFLKFPDGPQWKDDPAMKAFLTWMDSYYPEGDKGDAAMVYAYLVAETLLQVLKQCGNDLARENIMRQAANLHEAPAAGDPH